MKAIRIRDVMLGAAMLFAALAPAGGRGLADAQRHGGRAAPAGVASDIIARVVFEQVGKQLGQTFVIENRGRRRRHHRRQHGRQGRAGRPHRAGLWLDRRARMRSIRKLPYDTVDGFHAGGAVRPDAAGAWSPATGRYKTLGRADRGGEGQARRAELFDGRRRLGRAFRRRAACGQRRHSRRSTSRSRAANG